MFSCETFPKKQKKKRKRDVENLDSDILSEDFDKGDFTLCQLCGSDGNKNHTITITKEWIFDNNFINAMPLNEVHLHKCCGQLFDTTEKKCLSKSVLWHTDINMKYAKLIKNIF